MWFAWSRSLQVGERVGKGVGKHPFLEMPPESAGFLDVEGGPLPRPSPQGAQDPRRGWLPKCSLSFKQSAQVQSQARGWRPQPRRSKELKSFSPPAVLCKGSLEATCASIIAQCPCEDSPGAGGYRTKLGASAGNSAHRGNTQGEKHLSLMSR